MAIALRQTVRATSGFTATLSGSLLVYTGGCSGSPTQSITSITDNVGNTWTAIDSSTSGSYYGGLWYCKNAIAGVTSLSITYQNTPSTAGSCFREYTGLDANPLNVHAITNYSSVSTPAVISSPATGSTQQPVELVIGWAVCNGTIAAAGSGYGNLSQGGGTVNSAIEDLQTSVTGTQTATFTMSTGSAYICGVAAFKQPSGKFLPLLGCGS